MMLHVGSLDRLEDTGQCSQITTRYMFSAHMHLHASFQTFQSLHSNPRHNLNMVILLPFYNRSISSDLPSFFVNSSTTLCLSFLPFLVLSKPLVMLTHRLLSQWTVSRASLLSLPLHCLAWCPHFLMLCLYHWNDLSWTATMSTLILQPPVQWILNDWMVSLLWRGMCKQCQLRQHHHCGGSTLGGSWTYRTQWSGAWSNDLAQVCAS